MTQTHVELEIVKTSALMSEQLLKLRRTQTLNSLLYMQDVMNAIKKIPTLQPTTGTLKISMLTPTAQEQTDDQEEQLPRPTTKKTGRWYQNIPSKVKHK